MFIHKNKKLSRINKLTHLHYIQITSQLRGKFRDTQEQAKESGLAICNMKRADREKSQKGLDEL